MSFVRAKISSREPALVYEEKMEVHIGGGGEGKGKKRKKQTQKVAKCFS